MPRHTHRTAQVEARLTKDRRWVCQLDGTSSGFHTVPVVGKRPRQLLPGRLACSYFTSCAETADRLSLLAVQIPWNREKSN